MMSKMWLFKKQHAIWHIFLEYHDTFFALLWLFLFALCNVFIFCSYTFLYYLFPNMKYFSSFFPPAISMAEWSQFLVSTLISFSLFLKTVLCSRCQNCIHFLWQGCIIQFKYFVWFFSTDFEISNLTTYSVNSVKTHTLTKN